MKIIVSIQPTSFKEFEWLVSKINYRADIIEVWLDQIQSIDSFFEKMKQQELFQTPLLGVCKKKKEKGVFLGNETERVERLQKFIASGGSFVDLDILQNNSETIRKIASKNLFLSVHNFKNTPSDLLEIYEKMKLFDPAVYKFAVTPQDENDLELFLSFAKKVRESTEAAIFTTMGELGEPGREKLLSTSFAGFYALDSESKTASGQKCLEDLI